MERDEVRGEEEEGKSQFESLCEAVVRGNANDLREFLQKYSLILDQIMSDCVAKDNHPLHIGAQFGHVEIVRELLNRKPELTREINSQGLSPLHMASEKGHVEVVRLLLDIDADVCFLRDANGRTPLHLAAMKGRVTVLEELVRAKKIAAWIFTEQRQPILHVCAKHRQFQALKMLVNFVSEEEFANLKDSDDNTILHVLTAMEEFEVIKYLIDKKTGLDVNSMNVHGSTAMDVLAESNHGKPTREIRKLLRSAKAKLARDISQTPESWPHKRSQKLPPKSGKNQRNEIGDGLLVVAILIATVTFQAMANPPGGLWQDDNHHNVSTCLRNGAPKTDTAPHEAGTAIMAYKFGHTYGYFKIFNSIGFVASLILIVLLVSRFSLKRKASVRALTVTTWIAVSSMFITYFLFIGTVAKASKRDVPQCREEGEPVYRIDATPLLGRLVGLILIAIWGPLQIAFMWLLSRYLKRLLKRIRCASS